MYNRSTMRFASLKALPSRSLLVLALAAGLCAQPTSLELGKTISGDLSGGQTHSYSITVAANQYVRAVVTQPVAAVMVDLYTPDGKKALEVDTRNYLGQPARIVWESEDPGDYRIGVSGSGHYEIKLEELRAGGADDRKRVEAERLFAQGLSEAHKNAYDQAILSFTRALELYRKVHDLEPEGDVLYAAGTAYRMLNQNEKGISSLEQALAIYRETKDRRAEGRTLDDLGIAHAVASRNERR